MIFLWCNMATAESELPLCQGEDYMQWTNCYGTYTFPNGTKFVGEFKDGEANGQGTYTYANGNKFVGEYKDGKLNGQVTYTWPDGNKEVSVYKDGELVKIISSTVKKESSGDNNSVLNANSQTYNFSSKKVVCTSGGCAIKCTYSGGKYPAWRKFYDNGYHVSLPRWGCPSRLDVDGYPVDRYGNPLPVDTNL